MSSLALKVQDYVAEIRQQSGRWPDAREVYLAFSGITLDLAYKAVENVKRLWRN